MQISLGDYQIRSWSLEDAEDLTRHANNANIAANLRDGFPHPYTVADARSWLQNAICQDIETVFAIATSSNTVSLNLR